jgi:hypothetical protein
MFHMDNVAQPLVCCDSNLANMQNANDEYSAYEI